MEELKDDKEELKDDKEELKDDSEELKDDKEEFKDDVTPDNGIEVLTNAIMDMKQVLESINTSMMTNNQQPKLDEESVVPPESTPEVEDDPFELF